METFHAFGLLTILGGKDQTMAKSNIHNKQSFWIKGPKVHALPINFGHSLILLRIVVSDFMVEITSQKIVC